MPEKYRCPNCNYHDERVQIEEVAPAATETETNTETEATNEAAVTTPTGGDSDPAAEKSAAPAEAQAAESQQDPEPRFMLPAQTPEGGAPFAAEAAPETSGETAKTPTEAA